MEGWKDGRMEGWKDGRMEGWKDGRMEGWKDGRMEGWKGGRMAGWKEVDAPKYRRLAGGYYIQRGEGGREGYRPWMGNKRDGQLDDAP
jgi:hypothetical protein